MQTSSNSEYKHNWYIANRDKTIERSRKWYKENPERAKELANNRRKANREKRIEYMRIWRENNRDKYRLYIRNWKSANPGKVNAETAKRYTNKIQRTPSWLSLEQTKQIKNMYVEAARLTELTGICFHVDHIVPLNGKTVCGLHVPWNLQVLPCYANIAKGNKYDGTK